MGATEIGVLANTVGWRPTSSHGRTAEPSAVRTLPVIDNTLPNGQNVRTSVDCYVSGQYVQRNGKSLEVTQRYSIFVSYNKQTQYQTLKQVNDRVASDFQDRYGGTFNITTIYVPSLPIPPDDMTGLSGSDVPMELYLGSHARSGIFSEMKDYQKLRLDVGKERTKERLNIQSIRARYNYGKR